MLNLDVTDRRRLVVAAALTIVALPAIWLFARSEPSQGTAAPSVVAGAGIVTPQGGVATTAGTSDPFGTDGPIFVDGPTTPPKPAIVPIVVPAQAPGTSIVGNATYKTNVDPNANTCSSALAEFNATLKVTNVDNGRSITCINRTPRVLPDGLTIELTTADFQKIAALVDAPVPVSISWVPG
ncbi:MAG: hypothetical protein JWM34_3359 [Ilumatobacteraceae bacterium]|nr:hypothetical protein [Ilumatobacteraceae bacterium]